MKAMLLAAGEGTRFRPHTSILPKPALPLLNVPLGFYSFDFLKNAGVESLVVNTFHLPDEIKRIYQSQQIFPVEFSAETEKILGSGGGLANAEQFFRNQKNFFLLNADEVLITQNSNLFSDLMKHHLHNQALSTLMVIDHPEVGTKFGGVWVNSNEQVIGFGKNRPPNAVHGYHFLGVQALSHNVFQYLPENIESNILYDGLMKALQNNEVVQVFKTDCHWFETGNLTDYLSATRTILSHLEKKNSEFELIRQFLEHMSPESHLISINNCPAWIHSQSKITNSLVEDFLVLGKNSHVLNSTLNGVVVDENQTLVSTNLIQGLIL